MTYHRRLRVGTVFVLSLASLATTSCGLNKRSQNRWEKNALNRLEQGYVYCYGMSMEEDVTPVIAHVLELSRNGNAPEKVEFGFEAVEIYDEDLDMLVEIKELKKTTFLHATYIPRREGPNPNEPLEERLNEVFEEVTREKGGLIVARTTAAVRQDWAKE